MAEPVPANSGVRFGPLQAGERVSLTDNKGRRHSVQLKPGGSFHSSKGAISHDDLIGGPEGVVATTAKGQQYQVLRPLLADFTTSMPRGAAVIYPKDAAQIVAEADIFPGARVLEAGLGSGALACWLLRAIGPSGILYSYERRPEFAAIARQNVTNFLGYEPANWEVRDADAATDLGPEVVDRVILDMLAPWECLPGVATVLGTGGVLCCYVATTTQLGRTMDTLRAHGGFTEPVAWEYLSRRWHAEGLAIRPAHGGSAHTGFLIFSRRLASGVQALARKRRPAPGAYGADYHGPMPADLASLREPTEPGVELPRMVDVPE